MAETYHIVTENLSIDNILAQLRAIPEFPATIKIYDRVVNYPRLKIVGLLAK